MKTKEPFRHSWLAFFICWAIMIVINFATCHHMWGKAVSGSIGFGVGWHVVVGIRWLFWRFGP